MLLIGLVAAGAVLPFVFLACSVIPHWMEYTEKTGRRTFAYRITDLWAAVVGLAATSVVLVLRSKSAMNGTEDIIIRAAVAIAVYGSELVGMACGKLKYEARYCSEPFQPLRSAMYILANGLLALWAPLVSYFVLVLARVIA
jgi:hypothetical protein